MPAATRPRPRRRSSGRRGSSGWVVLAVALVLAALGVTRTDLGVDVASWSDGRAAVATDAPGVDGAADEGAVPAGEGAAEAALVAAIQRVRGDHDLAELRVSAPLGRAARGHSVDLRDSGRCGHDGSDGSSLDDRLGRLDVVLRRYGEVVACGAVSADAAVAQWLGSRAHRAILLGDAYGSVGVGVALGVTAAGSRWTAVLGSP